MAVNSSAAIRVEGLDELRKALRELGDAELRKALRLANKASAQLVVQEALPQVPVRSGKLKASVKAMAGERDARARAGGPTVPYAQAVHWGTGPRPGLRGPHNIARNPFLLNAAEAKREEVAEAYLIELDKILEAIRA